MALNIARWFGATGRKLFNVIGGKRKGASQVDLRPCSNIKVDKRVQIRGNALAKQGIADLMAKLDVVTHVLTASNRFECQEVSKQASVGRPWRSPDGQQATASAGQVKVRAFNEQNKKPVRREGVDVVNGFDSAKNRFARPAHP